VSVGEYPGRYLCVGGCWSAGELDGFTIMGSNHGFHVYDAPAEMPGETQIGAVLCVTFSARLCLVICAAGRNYLIATYRNEWQALRRPTFIPVST
jgi:hypothetical protein